MDGDRLGSEDTLTEKSITLDEIRDLPNILLEEKKVEIDPETGKPKVKPLVRRDDVDVISDRDRPPTPEHTDKPLVSKWDRTFATDDKTLNKRITEK